jgi:cell volume regulation protein A
VDITPQVLAAEHVLLICAVVLGAGAVLTYVSTRTGVPDIVLFLLAGFALGPAAGDLIAVRVGSTFNQIVFLFGAAYILFDGGVAMRLAILRRVWLTLLLLATVGVLITATICGIAGAMFFGIPLPAALLMASVIASTDPAALVPIFRQIKVRERIKQTVIAESAANDAVAAILTFAMLGLVTGESVTLVRAATDVLWKAGAGIVIGAAGGYVMCMTIAHERFGILRDNLTLGTLIVVIGAVLVAGHYQASGFMAVFAAGVVVGNKGMFGFSMTAAEEDHLQRFIETTGLIMRMFIFIFLGASADWHLVGTHILSALGVVMVLILVARPLTVFACAAPDRRAGWRFNELLFICWTRETGVIPAALAGMLQGQAAPHSGLVNLVTFVTVLVTIGIQATTTPWVARRLGVLER